MCWSVLSSCWSVVIVVCWFLMVCVNVNILSRTRVNVLSALVLELAVAVAEVGESGSESGEARVEVDDRGEGEREETDVVECGDAGTVSDNDDSVRSVLVRDAEGAAAAGGLRVTDDGLVCGSGAADDRRGRMVASVCCHCCKLSSCLAVSSAIASMNASMSTLRVREDDGRVDDDESRDDEDRAEWKVRLWQ